MAFWQIRQLMACRKNTGQLIYRQAGRSRCDGCFIVGYLAQSDTFHFHHPFLRMFVLNANAYTCHICMTGRMGFFFTRFEFLPAQSQTDLDNSGDARYGRDIPKSRCITQVRIRIGEVVAIKDVEQFST